MAPVARPDSGLFSQLWCVVCGVSSARVVLAKDALAPLYVSDIAWSTCAGCPVIRKCVAFLADSPTMNVGHRIAESLCLCVKGGR